LHVVADFGERGPVAGLVRGKAAIDGIDSKRKKFVERGCARFQRKQVGAKKVPVEGFKMADIKNDSIAFRDRTFVERIFTNNVKQAIAVGTSFQNKGAELVLGLDSALRSHDSGLPGGRGVPTRIEMRERSDLANKNRG